MSSLVIPAVFAVAFAALVWRVFQLQRLLAVVETDQARLASTWNALPPDARNFLPSDGAFISIEILNPLELAAAESKFGGVMGAVTPGLLRSIVYQRTTKMLREELVKYGVQADVQLRGMG